MHEYGTLKPVESILRREKRENNGGDEPNQVSFYTYVKPPVTTIIN
jgi:hypothetical protein